MLPSSSVLYCRRLPALLAGLFLAALAACAGGAAVAPESVPAAPAGSPGPLAVELPPPTEVVAGSRSLAYYLGESAIDQPWAGDAAPQLPLPLLGAISVPEGEGPFPVAFVLHGRHPRCYSDPAQLEEIWPCEYGLEPRYDVGFYPLLDALSARGYLAVAPDLNGAYTSIYGLGQESLETIQPNVDDRLMRIVNAHLEKLAAANAGEPVFGEDLDLTGKVDADRIVVAGHSAAGSGANRLARGESAGSGPLPIRAQLLVAPLRFPASTGPTADVPTAVLLSGCDGDLAAFPGQGYYEAARDAGAGSTAVVSVWLPGANHNFYNTELVRASADDGFFSRNPACASLRLTADEQQAFLGELATDFFDEALDLADAPPAFLDAAAAPATLYGRDVQSALLRPSADYLTLLPPPPASAPGDIEGPLVAVPCAGGTPCDEATLQPGDPVGWRLSWSGQGAALRLPVPPGATGAGEFAALKLRAVVDPVDPNNNAAGPVTFSVALTDAGGATAVVPLPATLPFPPPATYETDGFRFTPLYAGDIRLPLSAFEGVDLAGLASVSLIFDDTIPGAVYVPEVALVR
jgi:dienelactone hydrolase